MKKLNFILPVILGALFIFSSCSKEYNGDDLTTKKANKMIVGTWDVEAVGMANKSLEDDEKFEQKNYTIEFNKNKDYNDSRQGTKGTWEVYEDGSVQWIKTTNTDKSSDIYEIEFVSKKKLYLKGKGGYNQGHRLYLAK